MKRIIRRITVSEILLKSESRTLDRDLAMESFAYSQGQNDYALAYHGIYDNEDEVVEALPGQYMKLAQKNSDIVLGEDPVLGDMALFREKITVRFDLLISFTDKHKKHSSKITLDINKKEEESVKEGMKIWAVLEKCDSGYEIVKLLL